MRNVYWGRGDERRGEGAINEDLLIDQIVSGDQSSYRILVDQYRYYLFKTVYAILRNEADAQDALQDVFVKIYYALPGYEKQGLKTWMTRIAVNHAIDMKRQRERRAVKAEAFANESIHDFSEPSLDTPLLKWEQKAYVHSRIKEMPENYRQVIQAYYLEDKDYKQIAEDMQIAVKTVEMRLYRARHWLRKHWKEEEF